jgi:hypothetical protein
MRKQLAKNKNRQDAARKRVRDNNGKFQGGLLYRKPKILFLVEKVNRTPCTKAPQQTFSFSAAQPVLNDLDFKDDSQSSCESASLMEVSRSDAAI